MLMTTKKWYVILPVWVILIGLLRASSNPEEQESAAPEIVPALTERE
jgi:hypothetical protein